MRIFKEKNIKFISGSRVKEVTPNYVILEDGRKVLSNVHIWATGA